MRSGCAGLSPYVWASFCVLGASFVVAGGEAVPVRLMISKEQLCILCPTLFVCFPDFWECGLHGRQRSCGRFALPGLVAFFSSKYLWLGDHWGNAKFDVLGYGFREITKLLDKTLGGHREVRLHHAAGPVFAQSRGMRPHFAILFQTSFFNTVFLKGGTRPVHRCIKPGHPAGHHRDRKRGRRKRTCAGASPSPHRMSRAASHACHARHEHGT